MLSPSIALLISIAIILGLIRLKIPPCFAVFTASLIISLLILPPHSVPGLMLMTLLDPTTLSLLVIVASALTLSRLMEIKGLLTRLAAAMECMGSKLAMHLVPAVIGLVPMPAGALVSATALRDLIKRMGLTPEQATFINYWFRHIWEYCLPVYPALITASVVLSIQLSSIVTILFPMTVLSVAVGTISSYRIFKRKKSPETRVKTPHNTVRNLLSTSWPIILVVLLVLLGINAAIAFPVTLALLALQQRAKWPELKKALNYGLDPKMLFLLYAVMLYKATIENSGAAYILFSDMQSIGMPAFVVLVALPFLMGFATGIGMAFAGIAFPLLLPLIATDSGINSYALLLAFTSGEVGVMLSPVHLCLIVTIQYFKANLTGVYKHIVPPLLAIGAIAVFMYLVAA